MFFSTLYGVSSSLASGIDLRYSIIRREILYLKIMSSLWKNITTELNENSSEPVVWGSLSLVIIIISTVCGNSLVCIAVIRERQLRNTTNYFLTSLAFTDCLVACLVMPLAVIVELIGHFPLDSFACNIWLTFDVCCSTSSIWHMSVMSLDRYLTLRYPLKFGRNKRRSLMAYKIITIWLISFAICLPLFILGQIDSTNVFNKENRACFPQHRTFKIYGSIVAFFIPLMIMIVTYTLTMSSLQQAVSTKKKRIKGRNKMALVLNLATMAVRWRRAVNTPTAAKNEEILDNNNFECYQHSSPVVENIQEQIIQPSQSGKRRAYSLLPNDSSNKTSETDKRNSISINYLNKKFIPTQQLQKLFSYHAKPAIPDNNEVTFPSERNKKHKHLLDVASTYLEQKAGGKRSHSCTQDSLNSELEQRKRRSSSTHTLLQIRRDSQKIGEELANLCQQVSSLADRNSMTKFSTSQSTDETHTFPIDKKAVSSALETIIPDSNLNLLSEQERDRAHSFNLQSTSTYGADISLSPSNQTSSSIHPVLRRQENISETNALPLSSVIPNVLITHEIENRNSLLKRRLTSPSPLVQKSNVKMACRKLCDWITVTSDGDRPFHSINNLTEQTPIMNKKDSVPPLSLSSTCLRLLPNIEQFCGETTLVPENVVRQQLLVDDAVPSSVHSYALQRSSICSITSNLTAYHRRQRQRGSSCSFQMNPNPQLQQIPINTDRLSLASATLFQKRSRFINGSVQGSFQMVSIDTESSSCSSSMTHTGITYSATNPFLSTKKHNRPFKNLTKSSVSNERKAMRVLLVIFAVFVILWTPFFIMNLLSCFVSNIPNILLSMSTWLGYCSSGANPIIYTIFSRAFRRAFYNIIFCKKIITPRKSQLFSPSCNTLSITRNNNGRKHSNYSYTQAGI
ncbi:unnamed protein product [Didymodactylos carnosus]|uniref:G-protein coupled receptors family 1 profile domain-containing protein n=2 Tax=Didymodactylos carnosus TaxID=1234261 RepID=A0A814RJM0_9BILA|nr:unnamed protein product [Didymodactylos carnosus]CAF3898713.1 unnamed protein product [Didymodactylos carnosus]